MSAEKLSELSKPVAWKFKNADGGDRVSLERKANIYGRHDFQPLYSQEYVSALTQRIAELERANTLQDDHINQQQDRIDSLEKTNASLGRGLEAAEKRLATPVRLPQRKATAASGYGDGYLVDSAGGDCFDRDDVIEALREQGFIVEGGVSSHGIF